TRFSRDWSSDVCSSDLRLRTCMEGGESVSFINEFTYPDGHTGHFELRMYPVPSGVLIMSLNVTEHVPTRQALDVSVERAMQAGRSEERRAGKEGRAPRT